METELKFELDPATADRLLEELALASKGEELILKSVYYDTEDQALRGRGLALRVREEGDRRIQTVKAATSGRAARGEWEREIAGLAPDMDAARDSPLAEALGGRQAALKPAFEVTVERARRRFEAPGGVVEVALDRGAVSAGGSGAPICELELELKAGSPDVLFDLAQGLATRAALQLSFTTKAERGYALIDGTQRSPVKAVRPRLDADAASDEAFRAIAAACLIQITANAQVLRAVRRPEAVHQLRVGLRRLRTALRLFEPMLADARVDALESELKWIAGELDAARNIDVFLAETFRPAAVRRKGDAAMAALGARLLDAQSRSYVAADSAVCSPRFHQLALDLFAWIETGPWLHDSDPYRAALRSRPARALAADALGEHWRKTLKRSRRLKALRPEQRHRARIEAKKLRYAGEFFGSLFPGRAARRAAAFARTLDKLQDALGELNDVAVGGNLVRDLVGAKASGDGSDALAAFAAGQLCADRDRLVPEALAEAKKARRRLAATKPFWAAP